jgi:hypothetical protein
MKDVGSCTSSEFFVSLRTKLFLLVLAAFVLSAGSIHAEAEDNPVLTPACILKKGVYTCDGVTFQKILANAKTVSIDTHRIDKVAQSQLTDFIQKKLHKTVATDGGPSDLIFLLMPIDNDGINYMENDIDLGTLRVYLPNSQNQRGDLIWAEVFYGRHDMTWPSVVTGVIDQFRSRFKIK